MIVFEKKVEKDIAVGGEQCFQKVCREGQRGRMIDGYEVRRQNISREVRRERENPRTT